jgi:hypothetical protein
VDEIQVGILKRLRGAPIARHTDEHRMRYAESAPYEVLETDALSFVDVQRLKRFARYFDLVKNSGRFPATSTLLLEGAPFEHMLALADWIWATTRATAGIALARLADLLHRFLVEERGLDEARVRAVLEQDLGRDKLPNLPARQARHRAV